MILKYLALALMVVLVSCVETPNASKGGIATRTSSGPDPLAPYLWHLNPVVVPYVNSETITSPHSHINLSDVHNTYQGRGVTIVVSDSHAQMDHPDLHANADVARSKNYVFKSGSVLISKSSGPYYGNPFYPEAHTLTHGTNVAGPALSTKNNGVGGFGVAPKATLVNYNYLFTDFRRSIQLDQFKIDGGSAIFNYSYGPANDRFYRGLVNDLSEDGADEIINELSHQVIYNNNIYVQASGNEFSPPFTESTYGNSNFTQISTYPQVIVVGATNAQGFSAAYSTPGSNVWISAPGGDVSPSSEVGLMVPDIVGCDKGSAVKPDTTFSFDLGLVLGLTLNKDCSHFSSIQGTSFAAPIVSGVIALMKEANPRLTWREIKMILASTATRINPTNAGSSHPGGLNLAGHLYQQGWVTNSAGRSFHPWYGFGLVNTKLAVDMAKTYNQSNTLEAKVVRDFNDNDLYFINHAPALSIPDANASGRTSSIFVGLHKLQIEHVLVKVNINHSRPSDIGIELTSPSGTITKLMNINSQISGTNLINVKFGANAFLGERTTGAWTLRVLDGTAGVVGSLNGWSISFLGNRGSSFSGDSVASPKVTGLSFNESTSTLSWNPSGDFMRYEVCVFDVTTYAQEGESKVCMDGDWRPVLTNSVLLQNYVEQGRRRELEDGIRYGAVVRVIDSAENESVIEEIGFTK